MQQLPTRIWCLGANELVSHGSLASELEAKGCSLLRLEPEIDFAEKRLKNEKHVDIGLVVIEDASSEWLTQVEVAMIEHKLPWMVLISEALADDCQVRRLVLDLGVGFAVLPAAFADIFPMLVNAANLSLLQRREIEWQNDTPPDSADSGEHEMVGTTSAMWELFKTIRKVAAVDASVCIHGESGTGKELTAQAIHERSPRAGKTFHAINCGALPDNLIHSELFGHEKGAFTGADQRKIGRIEAAHGGTLFLDEIGDLPLDLQTNLLRVLETRSIQRVGGLEEIDVDVRIICATHVDLAKAVKEGRFREDLYHRLNVLQVNVPPLRKHPEDIEVLAHFFFKRFINEKSAGLKGFSREALAVMRSYHWPGNVRELINRVRRAMVMCESRLIQPTDLGIERRNLPRHIMTLDQARDDAEYRALRAALGRNRFQVNIAAKELGVSRVTIYRLMEKHNISRESEGADSRKDVDKKEPTAPP
ncbi:MAG TPA: sigma-54 dependent transcriptional regulator [Halomonas sp.]|nr:sigma-54 dependent transcriptional regulator [Halomonas sp.]